MHLPSATAPLFCPAHRRKSAQAGGTGSEYWLPGHDPHNLALPVALPQKILDVRARVSLLLLRTLRPPSAAVITPAIVEGKPETTNEPAVDDGVTATPETVAVNAVFALSMTVIDWLPAVFSVTLKVWTPASLLLKV